MSSSRKSGQAVISIANSTNNKSKFALLHVFPGHSKAVTGIKLHPTPGLAITVGMDGFIKVLNLEALNELFILQVCEGIQQMEIVLLNNKIRALLFSQSNSVMRLMKIVNTTRYFATSVSIIHGLESCENFELLKVEQYQELRIERIHQQKIENVKNEGNLANAVETFFFGEALDETVAELYKIHTEEEEELNKEEEEQQDDVVERQIRSELIPNGNISSERRLILASSSQDIRVFTMGGRGEWVLLMIMCLLELCSICLLLFNKYISNVCRLVCITTYLF